MPVKVQGHRGSTLPLAKEYKPYQDDNDCSLCGHHKLILSLRVGDSGTIRNSLINTSFVKDFSVM